ncbi:MAG: NAD(P)-dependent oxidoreductase [Nitrospirae bacterium]|nr:NAD(P)-dependent oxidoreductase [Nitrospirota bacterium]
MKLIITGALGHIGSRFIHDLRPGDFDQVILVDNLVTQRYASLFNLPDGVPFQFIEADIFKADLDPLFKDAGAVLHLAAVTDAAGSFDIRDEVERVNHKGMLKVAQACIRTGSPLIFISSTSVYGTQKKVVDEDCSVAELCPQSPYAEAKLKSERMLQTLGEREGLRFITCRFGTIFGISAGMRFHTAVNKFVWQACLGKPITVWRTAMDQKRPYLDLGDAVLALRFIMKRELYDNRVYNVLTANASVSEIVEIIRARISDLQVEYVDAKIMNQLSYHVLNDRFRALGFEFTGSLKDGIEEMVRLLRNVHPKQAP